MTSNSTIAFGEDTFLEADAPEALCPMLLKPCTLLRQAFENKVIIEKSRSEVSLMGQDTIENVS